VPIDHMGKFTAIGMRIPVIDPNALVINTCGGNDTNRAGTETSWDWCNPTSRKVVHTHPHDPAIMAVSVECMWQGTKIFSPLEEPDQRTLQGEWRRGKGKRPIGAWDGPDLPLITHSGMARRVIYIPCYARLIGTWLAEAEIADRVARARAWPGNVYLRDHDTGRGVMTTRPMSHAWVLAMYLNNGVWPVD
jgi:hypothetical protein